MQNNAGWSALHFAAQAGSRECIRILIKYESHIKSKKGARAIDIAVQNNDDTTIKYFEEYANAGINSFNSELTFAQTEECIDLERQILSIKKQNEQIREELRIQKESNDIIQAILDNVLPEVPDSHHEAKPMSQMTYDIV